MRGAGGGGRRGAVSAAVLGERAGAAAARGAERHRNGRHRGTAPAVGALRGGPGDAGPGPGGGDGFAWSGV